MANDDKKMIALQLNIEMYQKLKYLSEVYTISISGVVRLIINDYLNRFIDNQDMGVK